MASPAQEPLEIIGEFCGMSVAVDPSLPVGVFRVESHVTFYLATCLQCEPALPMPFYDWRERAEWSTAHKEGAGHDQQTLTTEIRHHTSAGR